MGARRTAKVSGVVVTVGVLTAAPALAAPVTDQEVPFPCGQDWYGSSRSYHSPSSLAIDWNRTDDLGMRVVASGPGVVSRVADLGSSSYGLYVVIDHRRGESSLYAHMSAEFVTEGQRVDQGQLIGRVGESGNVTGPHLHYEQRQDGTDRRAWFHGRAFRMGTTVASRNCPQTPVAGDWDHDGHDEVGTFRRGPKGGFRLDAAGGVQKVRLGAGTDDPLVGDWNGDGAPDLGVRHPTNRTFVLRGARRTQRVTFGARSDHGVAGDWDGDGRADVGVWRPASGRFLLRNHDGSSRRVRLGSVRALPVTGDWNRDGRTDLGAFSKGTWSLWARNADGTRWRASVELGSPRDLPVTGDWNGDGATDLGVWDPASATFTLRRAAPLSTRPGRLTTRRFGTPR